MSEALPNTHEFVDLSDGRCHYRIDGDPDGRPLLLIHGATVPAWEFDGMVPYLERAGYLAVLPDLFGHGYSDRPRTVHDYPLFVRQLLELLGELNVEGPVDVLGHSLGSVIGLRLAVEVPDRIRSLLMAAPMLDFLENARAAGLLRVPGLGELLTELWVVPMLVRRRTHRYRDIEDGRFVGMFRDQLKVPGFGRSLLSLMRSGALADQSVAYESFAGTGKRVLILRGNEDTIVSEKQWRRVRELVPGAKAVEIEGTAHAMLLTHPEKVAPHVVEFLNGRDSTG